MPTKGYDAFFPDPGAHAEMHCRVCHSLCAVQRGKLGPTGFNEAVCGVERLHDRFICPHSDLPWHSEALALLWEAEHEPDSLVAAMLRGRAARIVARHRPA